MFVAIYNDDNNQLIVECPPYNNGDVYNREFLDEFIYKKLGHSNYLVLPYDSVPSNIEDYLLTDSLELVLDINKLKMEQQNLYNNHDARMKISRDQRFTSETDGLGLKYVETGLAEDKTKWVNAKNQIRNELKYLEEMTLQEKQDMYPLLDF